MIKLVLNNKMSVKRLLKAKRAPEYFLHVSLLIEEEEEEEER